MKGMKKGMKKKMMGGNMMDSGKMSNTRPMAKDSYYHLSDKKRTRRPMM